MSFIAFLQLDHKLNYELYFFSINKSSQEGTRTNHKQSKSWNYPFVKKWKFSGWNVAVCCKRFGKASGPDKNYINKWLKGYEFVSSTADLIGMRLFRKLINIRTVNSIRIPFIIWRNCYLFILKIRQVIRFWNTCVSSAPFCIIMIA